MRGQAKVDALRELRGPVDRVDYAYRNDPNGDGPMLAMAETVWLQLGPTMCDLYGRLNRTTPPQHHRLIVAALKAGDEPGLRVAVRADVTQGLRMLAT